MAILIPMSEKVICDIYLFAALKTLQRDLINKDFVCFFSYVYFRKRRSSSVVLILYILLCFVLLQILKCKVRKGRCYI